MLEKVVSLVLAVRTVLAARVVLVLAVLVVLVVLVGTSSTSTQSFASPMRGLARRCERRARSLWITFTVKLFLGT